MLRLFANANYDFISLRWRAIWATVLVVVPGILFLAIKGLNYSIEFTGGTLIQIHLQQPVPVGDLRSGLERAGIPGAEITQFGSPLEFTIRARVTRPGVDPNDTQATSDLVKNALESVVGAGQLNIVRTEAASPKVSGELRQKAFLAIFLSFFAVLAYLAIRFEWRFGLAAVAATAHDIVATIAFISVLRLEVSLTVVAAVLSMVGYSLNDTIIIFDRVRENLHKMKKESFVSILNRSINETLPRSVLTHGTTLATLISLAFLGGEVIRPFALVMFFGVFTGTFSSIFIASPVLMWIEERWPSPAVRGHKMTAAGAVKAPGRSGKPQPAGR
ncbi:MAG: protein translocase subunit SecF [Gemmatimonadales bacterium]